MSTLLYFVLAIGILISFHEFGHFWIARKTGVKVLRFSVGFGKVLWRYQSGTSATEYVLSAIPLGGYVKMVDEREGQVAELDLPYAFNRQPLWKRTAIVAAGPIANLILAIAIFWLILMLGETGLKATVGEIAEDTLAYEAGFSQGQTITQVNGQNAQLWSEAMELIFASAMESQKPIAVNVASDDGSEQALSLVIPEHLREQPEVLYQKLGLKPWMPELKPIIGRIIPDKPAQKAGLQTGDVVIAVNGETVSTWPEWVDMIRQHPSQTLTVDYDRDGVRYQTSLTPEYADDGEGNNVGRIGAGAQVPETLLTSMQITVTLSPGQALSKAIGRTWFYSTATVKMLGQMLIGQASVKNLSGPISIAQFAGLSAEQGLNAFLSFLAKVSISLGVLNLLPIPVLDGGHLAFYLYEAVRGRPVSEHWQAYLQQIGIFLLLGLMLLATYLDIGRLLQ